jgi:fibronectin type 3 domain-containing protein
MEAMNKKIMCVLFVLIFVASAFVMPVSAGVGDYVFEEREYNDSEAYADRIYYDYTVVGNINGRTDMDYFKFVLSDSADITFLCNSDYSSLLVGIADSTGDIIGAAEGYYNDGSYYDACYTTLPAGTYYFVVLQDQSTYYSYMEYAFYFDYDYVHTHNYSSYVVSPTCTESGYTVYTCSCGYSYTGNYVSASAHKYGSWYVVTEASCYSTGIKKRVCNNCSAYETATIPITHSESGWLVDVPATPNTAGSQHKECTRCGKITQTEVIPALIPITPAVSTVNTISGVKVSWGDISNATEYVVYRRLGTESTWETIATTTSLSYEDKNVTLGNYYVYSVRAYNGDDFYSAYDKNKTSTIKPITAPTATATNVKTGVNVKWNAAKGATKYNVYRRLGGTSSWVLVGTTGSTSLVDTGITTGKYYVYSIRAINGTGYSAFDTNKTYTIQPLTAPTAVATNQKNGVKVTWKAASGATKYNVYRRVGGSSSWVLVGTTSSLSIVDGNVKNGTYYIYSIRAINSTGYSEFDTKKTDTIQPITAPVTKATKKSNGVQLTWNSVTGATKYNVYRRLGGTSNWILVGTTTGNSYLDKGVSKGKSYSYSIRAINGTGYSEYNSAKSVSLKY